jgi:hypothetical protein
MMTESNDTAVLGSTHFLDAVRQSTQGDYQAALASFSRLRSEYADDEHSLVEISRWEALMLGKMGKQHEALQLLFAIRPYLLEHNSDLSEFHTSVAQLLYESGDLLQLRQYCDSISTSSGSPLGHLEWLTLYLTVCKPESISPEVTRTVAECETQLGIHSISHITPSSIAAIVQNCIVLRDEGNARYANFYAQYISIGSTEHERTARFNCVHNYISSEPIPLYRQLALSLIENE